MSLPTEVVQAVRDRSCVLFLGTRASWEAARAADRAYPSASRLARELGWERPRRLMGARTRPVVPSVEQGAERFQEKHGREALVRELRGKLSLEDVEPTEAHRLAWKHFPLVFTTAWDSLLERAAQQLDLPLQVLDRHDDLPPAIPDRPTLVRLRGGFDSPSGIYATPADFREGFSSAARKAMRRLIHRNTVLFGGFRPDEEQFERLWEDLTDAYGGELPRCHLAVSQGEMNDFLWQKWVWRGLLLFTADPSECLDEIHQRVSEGEAGEP